MKKKVFELLRNSFIMGAAFAFGILSTGLIAAAITEIGNSGVDFSVNEILDAQKMNDKFTALRNAIADIDPQYSTSETATHKKWIDGKTIYRKVIEFGQLPNTTNASVPHGITSLNKVINISGYATNGVNFCNMPSNSTGASMSLSVTPSNIEIATGFDASGSVGVVILEYTKQ